MCKFAKLIINKKCRDFRNIQYLPNVISLYEKYSKYLHDDYFLMSNKTSVDAVINLVEKIDRIYDCIIAVK